jgi:putative CocE/NonD family hydrolase
MPQRSESMRIEKGAPMELRDGTILRADIYRLDDNLKHPAILLRSPYPRSMILNYSYLPLFEAVLAGYTVISQNVRGTFDSEGKWDGQDMYMKNEVADGYDSIEWIANQTWCDGNVGTSGHSYLGFIQLVQARGNPPHLKAISPWSCGSAGQADTPLVSGVAELGLMSWITAMGLEMANKLEKQGQDVTQMRYLLNRAVSNPEEVYSFLPLKDVPHYNFEGLKEIWNRRVLNPLLGPEFLEKGLPSYSQIKLPCSHISGWFDFFTWGTINNFQKLRKQGGSQLARDCQHLLLGPWGHGGPVGGGAYGGLDFGRLAGLEGSGFGAFNLAYYNKYLRGMDISLPRVRYFVMGKNVWQNADDWPLPQTQWQRFYLHSKGHANSSTGDGWLSQDRPASEAPDIFIYDPLFPVPTTGCRGHELMGLVSGPFDQSRIEKREDILCYTTPELKEDIEITGPLELHLFASTSARDTDFTAKLVDVYPDGRAFNVAAGIIRARFRHSCFTPELLTPGEVIEYLINLSGTSQLFRKGHCIRIDVSSSNFPEYDRNMNTGNPIGEDAAGIRAQQTLFHQTDISSYIDFPVIGRQT